MELDQTERRILGALIEKQWTTPDQYPLTLNGLVSACNQKSNRDPVLTIEDFEIEGCLRGLRTKGLVMVHERDGGRVQRFSERLGHELDVSKPELSIIAELLLRGPQTAPELYRRCARMASYESSGDVSGLLRELASRHLVHLLPKGAGQRHARWEHRLAPEGEPAELDLFAGDPPGPDLATPIPDDVDTVDGVGVSLTDLEVAQFESMAPPATQTGTAQNLDVRDLLRMQTELLALRSDVESLRRRVDDLEAES